MKRKDTSILLNEWKSFLNESQLDTEFIDSLSDEDRNALNNNNSREVNKDIETILGAMEDEIGLTPEQINAVLNKIKNLSAATISAAAEYHNERAYGSDDEPLEYDKDLSLYPEPDTKR